MESVRGEAKEEEGKHGGANEDHVMCTASSLFVQAQDGFGSWDWIPEANPKPTRWLSTRGMHARSNATGRAQRSTVAEDPSSSRKSHHHKRTARECDYSGAPAVLWITGVGVEEGGRGVKSKCGVAVST